jgi:hypothetical protein
MPDSPRLVVGQRERPTHDYRKGHRTWGHDLSYRPLPDDKLKATGWGSGLREGDYMLLSNGDSDTRYQIETIRYFGDPKDMWTATLRFAPRGDGC